MSKRLTIISFIVIGVMIFAIASFCLVLFLAPGLSVFGVKYIRHDLHLYRTGKFRVLDTEAFYNSPFNGDFVIQTSEVPVNIIYSKDIDCYFEYFDNFEGFTTSKFDEPSISITKDNNGRCVIKVTEFKKFLFETSSSTRYLNIYIPVSYVSGSNYKTVDLSITTDSAPITFSRQESGPATASHNKLEIYTKSGKINYETNVHCDYLYYTTNNSIKMLCDEKKDVFASNYYLESKYGKITFNKGVVGDIKAKTKNGDILLNSCKNLIAESNYGDVRAYGDVPVNVRGIVNIKTKSGKVTLGEVQGDGDNLIETGGGTVSIDKIKDVKITTKRGSIKINSVVKANIESNVGKVTVEEALESINVTTKRGNIVLGGSGVTMNNPTVFSRIGKVDMKSANGTVNIETVNSNISFVNGNSSNITIVCGKKLTASNLTGLVKISSKNNVDLSFKDITDRTEIKLGDKCKSAIIRAENDTKNDTKYYFEGRVVRRYEDDAVLDDGDIVYNETTDGVLTNAYISVEGKNAEILAYFKKPE